MARCQSQKATVMPETEPSAIHWPVDINPTNAEVFVVNKITTDKDIDTLWHRLRNAHHWPDWYQNSANVKIINREPSADGPLLDQGSTFVWEIPGMFWAACVIDEYDEAKKRLAWRAALNGMTAYHGWVFSRNTDGTVEVVTEECQVGPFARDNREMLTGAVRQGHQFWLEQLIS